MLGHLLLPEIQEMVRSGDFVGLRDVLEEWQPPDLAELILDLPAEDEAVIFRLLPNQLAAETFGYLPHESQEALVYALGDERAAELLNTMPADDRTAFLEEMPGEVTRHMLALLSPEQMRVAQSLLNYPEDSIGRIMTPAYLTIREAWNVDEVLDYIRRYGKNSETINVLYVTDRRGTLLGSVRIRDLLLAPRTEQISEVMGASGDFSLQAADDQESAIQAFRKYDLEALPVTDRAGALIGIITVDDVLDVVEEETTEDIQKLGGMEALSEPYMQIGFGGMVRKRAPWLILLFFAEMGATAAMANYDESLDKVVALGFFVPLIMSCGGNSGSQAGTLVIRAMALGEIGIRDWFRVLKREIFTSLSFGVTLGIIGFLMVTIWHHASGGERFEEEYLRLALTLGFSVLGVVVWGTLVGGMLPFILTKFKLDPATSSAPFVATLIDVTGLLIFFNVAYLFLKGTLL